MKRQFTEKERKITPTHMKKQNACFHSSEDKLKLPSDPYV